MRNIKYKTDNHKKYLRCEKLIYINSHVRGFLFINAYQFPIHVCYKLVFETFFYKLMFEIILERFIFREKRGRILNREMRICRRVR